MPSTFRYRTTITVETPEGDKTGSSVIEVKVYQGISIFPQMTNDVKYKGEGVVVDLGKRGLAFSILDGDAPLYLPCYTVITGPGCFSISGVHRLKQHLGEPVTLVPQWYPHLVYFEDTNDPTTVRELYNVHRCPQFDATVGQYKICSIEDNFEKAFGENVHLKSIVVEVTNDDVTYHIKKFLPKLHEWYGRYLDGQLSNNSSAKDPLANALSSGSFSTDSKSE